MEVFLPIAQVFVNPVEILLLSAIVGVLSGLFGVGGGFLMTPFLIFLGVPPAYAVANEANNILATSVSGSTTHYLKNTLDYKMGFMIVIGGTIGTALGIYTFTYFKGIGKIDTVISLAYMYYTQFNGQSGLSFLFLALFVVSNLVLFGGVYWSKFAHMFYKPGAAIQKNLAEADGSRDNLPPPADAPEQFGLGIKREQPKHY